MSAGAGEDLGTGEGEGESSSDRGSATGHEGLLMRGSVQDCAPGACVQQDAYFRPAARARRKSWKLLRAVAGPRGLPTAPVLQAASLQRPATTRRSRRPGRIAREREGDLEFGAAARTGDGP